MRALRRAFTLIELLVVVTVLSILMALLTPTIRAVRRHSKNIKCLHNVRQCGLALSEYVEDSRGMCPPWITFDYCQPVHGNWWWTTIHYLLVEYGDDPTGFWTCPADSTYDHTPGDGPFGPWSLHQLRNGCSYHYNCWGGKGYNRAPDEGLAISQWEGRYLADIKKPSKKIAMACWSVYNFWSGEGPGVEREQWWHSDPPELKAPVAFLDYHAEIIHSVPGKAETDQYKW